MSTWSADERARILEKWGFVDEPFPCVSCSSMGYHDVHHIVYRSQGGTNDPDLNLVPLCRTHHNDEHAKRIILEWVAPRRIATIDPVHGIISETTWPPTRLLDTVIGPSIETIRVSFGHIEASVPELMADEISEAVVALYEIEVMLERARMMSAYERVIRIPKGKRTDAAKMLAKEWSSRGYKCGEGTVRTLAKGWLLLKDIPEETFWEMDASARRLAAQRVGSLDSLTENPSSEGGQAVVAAWQDKPEGQSTRAFIAAQRSKEANPCTECGGTRMVPCAKCSGTGIEP
jgi:hypothetical protein